MDHFGIDLTPELAASSIGELVKNLDTNWEIGKKLLYSGMVEKKLSILGNEKLSVRAREIRNEYGDQNEGLEIFLREGGAVALPTVTVTQDVFDVETFEGRLSVRFTIENSGRGYLICDIESDQCWAVPAVAHFAGNRIFMVVDVDVSEIERGEEGTAVITIRGGAQPVTVTIRVKRRGLDEALSLYEDQKYGKVIQICDTILHEQPGQPDAVFLQALCYFREGNAREAFRVMHTAASFPQILPVLLVQDFFAELNRDEVFYPNLNKVISFYEAMLPHASYDHKERIEDCLADCYLKKAIIIWDKLSKKRDLSMLFAASFAHTCERSPFFNNVFYPLAAAPLSLILMPLGRKVTREKLIARIGGPVYAVDRLLEQSRLLAPVTVDWGKFSRKLRDDRKELYKKSIHVFAFDMGVFIMFMALFLGYYYQRSNDLYEQGLRSLRKGDYENAAHCFERSMEMGYRPAESMLRLGETHHQWARALVREKNYFSAIEHFNRALQCNPLDRGALDEKTAVIFDWGVLLFQNRNYRDAYMKFELLLSLDWNNTRAQHYKRKTLFSWASSLCDDQSFESARDILFLIDRAYPGDSTVRPLREKIYIRWAENLISFHRNDEALAKLDSLLKIPPQSPRALDLRRRYEGYRGMVYIEGMNVWKSHQHDRAKKYSIKVLSFYMDRCEVTNEQFSAFVSATGYVTELEKDTMEKKHRGEHGDLCWKKYSTPGRGKYPVIAMTLNDAHAYCTWAGKSLPSREQRELAAGYSEKTLYPWGALWDSTRCNSLLLDRSDMVPQMLNLSSGRGTLPVDSFPPGRSSRGISDLSGNVWEWIYSDEITEKGTRRLWYLAGGAWHTRDPRMLTGDSRVLPSRLRAQCQINNEGSEYLATGFRCVK